MIKIGLFQALSQDTWIKPFLKKYKKTLIFAIFFGILTFFCAAALMFNSGYLISRSASKPENILLVYIPIVLTRAFGIGRPVFRYIERLMSHNWVFKMTSDLRLKLYNTLEKDAIFFKRHYRTGDILGMLSEDINHIQNLYLRTLFPTIVAWTLYILLVVLLGFFSIWFALVMALLYAVVIIGIPLWSVIINGANMERQKEMKNELYKDLTDNVLGVGDWIFSQRSKDYVALHEKANHKLYQIKKKLRAFDFFRDLIVQLVFGVITISTILWTGYHFIGNHGGEANWIAAFVLVIFPLIDSFAPLSSAAVETNVYKDSINRLNSLPERDSEIEHAVKLEAPYTLHIKNLYFRYNEGESDILKGLSIDIPYQEKLAILGRSGAGKSTLAYLLRGDLVPSEGEVLINDIPTHSLGDAVSRYIGVLQQSPYLFNTTILNNLRIGRESATEEEVWEVLDRVGLRQLVEGLPQKLNTMVDEEGLRFSGGERQRMALARILLQDVPIVLLDEPTVGLDPITEQQLIDTFFETLSDRTVIWITHHLQGIENMDRVIFIEEGKTTIDGAPDKLLLENSHYQKLYQIDKGWLV